MVKGMHVMNECIEWMQGINDWMVESWMYRGIYGWMYG